MDLPDKRPPKKADDRVILQFDYDCFYAQVYENRDPSLKGKPLGIKQKNILATCNYAARSHGVRKLQLVVEARKVCPGLTLIEGEDLTPFRDASKTLFKFLRSYSWNGKVERLGLDEVFMDVTDIIDYNLGLVNQHSLGNAYFQLSQKDPACGFTCDYSTLPGCIEGSTPTIVDRETTGYLRLMLGSHLARYLRLRLEEDFGYTSTCGISTNKVLSKLIGAKNKPRNQTTLLALKDDDVQSFMDRHTLRNVPGIGFKTASVLEMYVTGVESSTDSHEFVSTVTVGQVRSHASITPGSLQRLLAGPGAEKGVGLRIWALLHGVDTTEVKEAGDIPSQISIEDTFKGLESLPQITEQLYALSCSLIRRMRVDLLVLDENADPPGSFKWLARPKTLRLSIRSWPQSGLRSDRSFSRTSRSGLVPTFVFDFSLDIEAIADRLLSESLLPLLRRLQSEAGQPWNLQLINICVANMVPGAAETGAGVGRDIANMLRKQEEVLAPWKITSNDENNTNGESEESEFEDIEAADSWGTTEHTRCPQCGHSIPHFALTAHLRYHEMEE